MEVQTKTTLLQPLIDASTEPDSTYNVVEAPAECVEVEEDGLYPIFIIAGPRIKLIRLVRLFCFFIINLLFAVYFVNANQLIQSMATFIVFNSTSISDHKPRVIYLMPALLHGLPPFLSVVFGFMSDYTHYQRAYLLSYSFVFSSISAFSLFICDLLISPHGVDLDDLQALYALIYVSVITYIIGLSMFYPISLAYGLDLLEGTKWEVKYLYFPMYYVVLNIGHIVGISPYHLPLESQLETGCTIIFCLMILIMILYFVFRLFKIFPAFDKSTEFDVIPFRKGVEIFWNSLKVLRTGQRSPRGHWFIQLSSEVYYGKYPRKQVQMVASFFEINFLLSFLFFLFATTRAMYALFPEQGHLLRFQSNITEVFCSQVSHQEPNGTVVSLIFINFITVILLTPFIEYYFYKIIFFFNSSENLKPATDKKSIWRKVLKCLRCFDRYWHVYDPILKRIFWGSIFGLLSIVSALCVEISRTRIVDTVSCNQSYHTYSTVSIFSQIPQYTLSGILEIVSYIGCLQFVYFQSNNTYKDQLKGLFFGLFYFYIGLANIICYLTYYFLSLISHQNGNFCLTHTIPCDDDTVDLTWILYVILFISSFLVTAAFAVFAHYRHHQLSNINKRGTFLIDEEG